MSLPQVQGRGFLISDGVELKFSKAGTAWARLPLSFKNSRKDDQGNWIHDRDILIEGTVFGPLAEFLADNVPNRAELWVMGDLYTEEYEGKTRVKMNVHAAYPAKAPARQPVAAAKSAESEFPF